MVKFQELDPLKLEVVRENHQYVKSSELPNPLPTTQEVLPRHPITLTLRLQTSRAPPGNNRTSSPS